MTAGPRCSWPPSSATPPWSGQHAVAGNKLSDSLMRFYLISIENQYWCIADSRKGSILHCIVIRNKYSITLGIFIFYTKPTK